MFLVIEESFLSSRELFYLLVSRLFLKKMEATLLLAESKRGTELPQLPKRKVLYLILHFNKAGRPLQFDEKEESSAYPSVRKNFLPHFLGKEKNRAPDYLFFLFRRWKRAYAPEL